MSDCSQSIIEKTFYGEHSSSILLDEKKSQKDSSNPDIDFNSYYKEVNKIIKDGEKSENGMSSESINESLSISGKVYCLDVWGKNEQHKKYNKNNYAEKYEQIKQNGIKMQNIKNSSSDNISLDKSINLNCNNNEKYNHQLNLQPQAFKKFSLPLNTLPSFAVRNNNQKHHDYAKTSNDDCSVISNITLNNSIHHLPNVISSKNKNLFKTIQEKVLGQKCTYNYLKTEANCYNNKSSSDSSESIGVKENYQTNHLRNEKIEEENINDDECAEEELEDKVEEIDNEQVNKKNKVNKIPSIEIKSDFIKSHYNNISNYSLVSNNSNSSNIKKKSYTDTDEHLSTYPYTYDPLSERSNNSGAYMTPNSIKNKMQQNYQNSMINPIYFGLFNNQNNNNFYNNQRPELYINNSSANFGYTNNIFNTTPSNDSGQSPNYLNSYNQYNYSNNNSGNNTPFSINVNNLNNKSNKSKHMYSASFQYDYNNPIINLYSNINNQNKNARIYNNELLNNYYANKYKKKNDNFKNNNFIEEKNEKQIINLNDIIKGKESRTTIMIKNTPVKYTINELEQELKEFDGKFDRIYIPWDYEKQGNRGYAFVNLTNPYHLLLFHEKFNGFSWSFCSSKKQCELLYANDQGVEELEKHRNNYKSSKTFKEYTIRNYEAKNIIEIPLKYIDLMKQTHPECPLIIDKTKRTFIAKSLR